MLPRRFPGTIRPLPKPDHARLTCRHAGGDFRLTTVFGKVLDEIAA